MLRSVVMTYILHICDMFNKMSVMASRGLVKSLIRCFHYHLCFHVIYISWKFHGVLGTDLNCSPKKVAQNPES